MANEKPIPVTFLIDKGTTDVFAYFQRTNYSKVLYQNRVKVAYSHIGQHTSCAVAYAKECKPAKPIEYNELKKNWKILDII